LASRRRDVQPEDRRERADEEQDSEATAEVAADERAEREEPEREGDETHYLAEDRACVVATERDRIPWAQSWIGRQM
jgi:hypothetical protein